jgi:hypothetical protein
LLSTDCWESNTFPINNEIILEVSLRDFQSIKVFSLGGSNCCAQFGNSVEIYAREINMAIKTKEGIIKKCPLAFPTWWLILVDGIHYPLSRPETCIIQNLVEKHEPFSKIILIDHQLNKKLEI